MVFLQIHLHQVIRQLQLFQILLFSIWLSVVAVLAVMSVVVEQEHIGAPSPERHPVVVHQQKAHSR
jgi:hypothetical protein